jgi:rhodanese-related sulfurtransferase
VSVPEIQVEELKQRLDHGDELFLLDVRDEYEYEITNIGGHLIPLAQLQKRLDELSPAEEIVAVCKKGPRGVKAVEYLQKHGFTKVSNLRGGLHAWSDRIDNISRARRAILLDTSMEDRANLVRRIDTFPPAPGLRSAHTAIAR